MASPGVGRAVAALIVLVWACPAWTQTHDADFPEQMAAINRCYVEHIKSGKPPGPDRWGDKDFWACMESQGFQFCGNCQIFRYSGGACRNDKNNAPDRATCWRPKGSYPKTAVVEFPNEVRGYWRPSEEVECKSTDITEDDGSIRVERHQLFFWEGSCELVTVVASKDGSYKISSKCAYLDEKPKLGREVWKLTKVGNEEMLVVHYETSGILKSFRRCSASSDADFPLQMKEINTCYIEHKRESLLPGTNAELRRCMREHGYQFCGHCDIDGRDCRLLELGAHRPDCYRLIGRVNDRGYPTDDSHASRTEREWDDTVERLIQKWTPLSSACRPPILDERRCDEFKMTEDILRDSHCTKITKNDAHWECPRLKDLPKGD